MVLTNMVSSKKHRKLQSTNKDCKKNLLMSYNLIGLKKPSTDKIEMCPLITKTCCRKED